MSREDHLAAVEYRPSPRRCQVRALRRFAKSLILERAGTKLEFLPDLRESVLPPVEPGKANPRLILAK
jgi:hypothetical protein